MVESIRNRAEKAEEQELKLSLQVKQLQSKVKIVIE
jgi:hypothetical protein